MRQHNYHVTRRIIEVKGIRTFTFVLVYSSIRRTYKFAIVLFVSNMKNIKDRISINGISQSQIIYISSKSFHFISSEIFLLNLAILFFISNHCFSSIYWFVQLIISPFMVDSCYRWFSVLNFPLHRVTSVAFIVNLRLPIHAVRYSLRNPNIKFGILNKSSMANSKGFDGDIQFLNSKLACYTKCSLYPLISIKSSIFLSPLERCRGNILYTKGALLVYSIKNDEDFLLSINFSNKIMFYYVNRETLLCFPRKVNHFYAVSVSKQRRDIWYDLHETETNQLDEN